MTQNDVISGIRKKKSNLCKQMSFWWKVKYTAIFGVWKQGSLGASLMPTTTPSLSETPRTSLTLAANTFGCQTEQRDFGGLAFCTTHMVLVNEILKIALYITIQDKKQRKKKHDTWWCGVRIHINITILFFLGTWNQTNTQRSSLVRSVIVWAWLSNIHSTTRFKCWTYSNMCALPKRRTWCPEFHNKHTW